jgi:hypothetical protein
MTNFPPPPDRLPGESIDRYLVRAAIEFKRLKLEGYGCDCTIQNDNPIDKPVEGFGLKVDA